MTKEACSNCKFMRENECHKAPPARLPRQFAPDAAAGHRVRDERLIWGWPQVEAEDWCGEHRWAMTQAEANRLDDAMEGPG